MENQLENILDKLHINKHEFKHRIKNYKLNNFYEDCHKQYRNQLLSIQKQVFDYYLIKEKKKRLSKLKKFR